MKTIHYVLIFSTVILALLVFFNWEKIKKLFSKKEEPTPNAYDECVKKNASLPDGADCTNCIPEGSEIALYNGKIKDGKCEPIRPDTTPEYHLPSIVQVTNPNGAAIYIFSGGFFQQARGGKVNYNSRYRISKIAKSSQGVFYKTSSGWLFEGDVAVG